MAQSNFESKIKLYCSLHGNNAVSMCNDLTKERNCEKCREKHDGICNIRYNGSNRQILYETKTGKIIAMSGGGYLEKQYVPLEEGRTYKFGDKYYPVRLTDSCWFCFGFLVSE